MILSLKEAQRALKNGEFIPYFQPLVTLRTGQLSGFEILARWKHPKKGIILPGQFIYAAETDGWIGTLMQELLRAAFLSAPVIPASLTLAVNVSPVQLRDLTLPRQIQAVAQQTGFSLDRLIIEITESALTDNLDHAQIIAKELKQLGCRIALDDFGTGYSSLLHLQSLAFDDLKVDRSFVGSMTVQRDSRKIVAAVIGLGQSLGLVTVAEGVETKEQAEMLLWMGCELGQGWLFGKPMPAEQLPAAVAAPRHRLSTGGSSQLMTVSAAHVDTVPSQRLAQLQAVYDGAPVGLAFLDRNLRHVNLNQRLADMNGFPVADHLGRTVAEMLPHLYPHVESYLQRALLGEAIQGVEAKSIDPITNQEKTLLVSYQPAVDEAHEIVGVSVSVMEITDRISADEALRESRRKEAILLETQAQLKAIVSAIPLGIVLADSEEGSPSLANPEALKILHEPLSEQKNITNANPWIAISPDSQLAEAAKAPLTRAVLHGETTAPEDVLLQRSDGTKTWVSLSGAPILGPDEKILGGVAMIQDFNTANREHQHLLDLAEGPVTEAPVVEAPVKELESKA
jgi:PAS domain S-box-containing protein